LATGDEVYGRSRKLREFCEAAGIGYVFAVPVDHRLTTSGGVRMRADQALDLVEAEGWNRRSCGAGARGQRYYDWAWTATDHPRRQLLIRRSIADPSEIAYFYAYARHVTLAMAALAFLAADTAIKEAAHPAPVLPEQPDQLPPADCGTKARARWHHYRTRLALTA